MTANLLAPASFGGRCLYFIEQLCAHLLLPFLLIWTYFRIAKNPEGMAFMGHPLGILPKFDKSPVWIHTAHAEGLTNIEPLLRELLQNGERVLVTYASLRDLQEGRRQIDVEGLTHALAPLDLFWACGILLFRVRPKVFVQCDTELWPAMLRENSRSGLPCVRLNARLDPVTIKGRSLLRAWTLGHYHLFFHIFVTREDDRKRYLQIGIPRERLSVLPEMARFAWNDPSQPAIGRRLRQDWPAEAKVLLFAETEEAEEEVLLDIFLDLRKRPGLEDLRLIWAPRSAQRYEGLASDITSRGLSLARRSYWPDLESAAMPTKTDVLLGDSLGELNIWYPMADMVFVGGSLIGHGGHDALQPMNHGKPVLMGPSIHRMERLIQGAAKAGALRSLRNADELYESFTELLDDADALRIMARAAAAFAEERRNPARRVVTILNELATAPSAPKIRDLPKVAAK